MELQARKYYDKMSNLINDQYLETQKDDFSEFESGYSHIEEFLDLFLKNLYNCSENDELLMRIKGNMTIQEYTDEVSHFFSL